MGALCLLKRGYALFSGHVPKVFEIGARVVLQNAGCCVDVAGAECFKSADVQANERPPWLASGLLCRSRCASSFAFLS